MNRIMLGYTPVSATVAFSPQLAPAQSDKEFKDGEIGIIVTDPLPADVRTVVIVVSAPGYQSQSLTAVLDGKPGVLPLSANLEPIPVAPPGPTRLAKPLESAIKLGMVDGKLQITGTPAAPATRIRMRQSNALETAGVLLPFTKTDGLTPGAKLTFHFVAENADPASNSEALVLDFTVPAPSPLPPPPPAPTPGKALADRVRLMYVGSAEQPDQWTGSITPADLARMNAEPYSAHALMVSGFTKEVMRPGYTFDPASFERELRKLDGLKKDKLVVLRDTFPSDPLADRGPWDRATDIQAQAAAIMRRVGGWIGFARDPEVYQLPSGAGIAKPYSQEALSIADKYGINLSGKGVPWWDFGPMFVFRDPKYQEGMISIHRRLAVELSKAFPGIYYGTYHCHAASDGAAEDWVNQNQAGNGFRGLYYQIKGFLDARRLDGANFHFHGWHEAFSQNHRNQGADIYARVLRYRTSETPNRLAIPGFADLQGFDYMRYASRLNELTTAQVLDELQRVSREAVRPGPSGVAYINFYHENGDGYSASSLEGMRQWAAWAKTQP